MATSAKSLSKLRVETAERFPQNLPARWREILSPEIDKLYFKQLTQFLSREYQGPKKIFPLRTQVLRALQLVDYDEVRVVILGQDPYHGAEQAIGLCFAVPDFLSPKPPSLVNVFKELEADSGFQWDRKSSELTGWANQGVLLLNTVLTVREAEAFSHREKGWEKFTDQIIEHLNKRERPIIFILWGAAAQTKKPLINLSKHFVLEAVHPSPLSAHRGFFGCRHFSKINQILSEKIGTTPIDWRQINAG